MVTPPPKSPPIKRRDLLYEKPHRIFYDGMPSFEHTAPPGSVTQEESDTLVGEQAMWLAVIERQIEDTRAQGESTAINRINAYKWLLQNNHDFPLVCRMAGVEPSYVRYQVLRRMREQGLTVEDVLEL